MEVSQIDPALARPGRRPPRSRYHSHVRRRRNARLRDQRLTDEEREQVRTQYQAEIERRREELRRYRDESEVPAPLQ
jgi:hypothetical protein